jgi:predicted protein tyrosine phosphatase
MQYFVMDRNHAKEYSFGHHVEKSIIISITDIDKNPVQFQYNPSNGIIAIKHLAFDDVEQGEINCITDADAMSIVDFIYDWKDKCDFIIVHCEAGQSRSAGVCAAIMKYIENDDWPIFDNPKYTPNMTCYRKVLNAFYCELNKSLRNESGV